MKRIDSLGDLRAVARDLGVAGDWHEPPDDVTAVVAGHRFDNAGFWPAGERNFEILEMHVVLIRDGVAVGAVNLATLFAWATGYRDVEDQKDSLVVALENWSRGAEVKRYARREGVTLNQAIEQLANHGLSHIAPLVEDHGKD